MKRYFKLVEIKKPEASGDLFTAAGFGVKVVALGAVVLFIGAIAIGYGVNLIQTWTGGSTTKMSIYSDAYYGYRAKIEPDEFKVYALKDDSKHTVVDVELDESLSGVMNVPRGTFTFVSEAGSTASYLRNLKIVGWDEGSYDAVAYDYLWTRIKIKDESGASVSSDQMEITFISQDGNQIVGEVTQVAEGFYVSYFSDAQTIITDVRCRVIKEDYQTYEKCFSADDIQGKTLTITLEKTI